MKKIYVLLFIAFVSVSSLKAQCSLAVPSPTICNGATCTLQASGAFSYTWTPSSGLNATSGSMVVASPSVTTIYTISATTGTCTSTATSTVTVLASLNAPILSASMSNPIIECQGVTPATLSLTTTASVTPVWYIGTSIVTIGHTYTPSTATPTTTIYTIIDSSTVTGCTSAAAGNVLTVTITVMPAPASPTLSPSIPNPLVECQGATPATLSLTTMASSITPVWYNGSTVVANGSTFTPNTLIPGTTVYIVSDSINIPGGCTNLASGNAVTVTVTINPVPTINVSSVMVDPAVCGAPNGGVSGLTGSDIIGGTPHYHYQWYNGSTAIPNDTLLSLSNVSGGTYSLQVIDANNCKAFVTGGTTTFTIPSAPTPIVSFTLQKDNSAADTWDAYVVYNNNGTGPVTYSWTWGDGSSSVTPYPSHTYSVAGTYSICVNVAEGVCTSSFCQNDSIYRLSSTDKMVYVNVLNASTGISQLAEKNAQVSVYPNPNNGTFIIETNSTEKQSLQVFDVNGKLVLSQPIPDPSQREGNRCMIDASALTEGVYNISIIGTTDAVNKRLMIVR